MTWSYKLIVFFDQLFDFYLQATSQHLPTPNGCTIVCTNTSEVRRPFVNYLPLPLGHYRQLLNLQ
ncbi:MAG: hypothetical protein QNJ54_24440 [Prochloraceae cyanobacterium]|nr:hypothetical protein [Prochloraceae cyanobacterium]